MAHKKRHISRLSMRSDVHQILVLSDKQFNQDTSYLLNIMADDDKNDTQDFYNQIKKFEQEMTSKIENFEEIMHSFFNDFETSVEV